MQAAFSDDVLRVCGCAACAAARANETEDPAYTVPPREGVAANGKPSFSGEQAAAQLTRDGYTWNGDYVFGVGATVTYAYRSSAPDTMPDDVTGFSRFSSVQISAAEFALQSWSDVANISFRRQSGFDGYSDNATILFANYSDGDEDSTAFAYYPGGRFAGSFAGDVWINSTDDLNQQPKLGEYGQQVLVHEIGHAIGLQHPSEYNSDEENDDPIEYETDAIYYEDSRQYTVMSYFGSRNTGADPGTRFAGSPQLDDIAAAQRLYGPNMSTRTGDTTYGFNSNADRPWFVAAVGDTMNAAIWDAGGTDTFDFSGYAMAQAIDLREGAFSDVGGLRGTVAVARGAVIENAKGGSGSDVLTGNAAANRLEGFDGDDAIYAGDQQDFVYGGSGSDRLHGELGYDGLFGDDGNDFIYGGSEDDLLAGQNGDDRLEGDAGDDQVYGDADQDVLVGGSGRDRMFGHSGFDAAYGEDGDDLLNGGSEDDLLAGQNGDDRLEGDAGDDQLYGDADQDALFGGSGADRLFGQAGFDGLYGDDGDDRLDGGSESDLLAGQNGDDRLEGGEGDDQLYGDADQDVLVGGGGADRLFGQAGFDALYGEDGNDALSGGSESDLLAGQNGDDRLEGGDADDLLYGDADQDVLFGGSGADRLFGHSGFDGLYGDDGNDVLAGGSENDLLAGQNGDDRLEGDAGDDQLYGDADQDVLLGGSGADRMFGQAGFDALYGEDGDDLLAGGSEGDLLAGQSGADRLDGEGGDDQLYGDDGDDVLGGGAGVDRLFGQGGADRFVFAALTDSAPGAADTVADFRSVEGDRIDLSAIDADSRVAGDQAFTFAPSFTGRGAEAVLRYDAASDTTSLALDVDGDALADSVLLIAGVALPGEGFVL